MTDTSETTTTATPAALTDTPVSDGKQKPAPAREIGGPKEADPTRYGDWTVKGRCIDF